MENTAGAFLEEYVFAMSVSQPTGLGHLAEHGRLYVIDEP